MSQENNPITVDEISVQELHKRSESGEKLFILDVREQFEYDLVNLDGMLIPLGELPDRIDELSDVKEQEIVVHCRSGVRSAEACRILMKNGFKHPRNLVGGINRWSTQIDPTKPTY